MSETPYKHIRPPFRLVLPDAVQVTGIQPFHGVADGGDETYGIVIQWLWSGFDSVAYRREIDEDYRLHREGNRVLFRTKGIWNFLQKSHIWPTDQKIKEHAARLLFGSAAAGLQAFYEASPTMNKLSSGPRILGPTPRASSPQEILVTAWSPEGGTATIVAYSSTQKLLVWAVPQEVMVPALSTLPETQNA